MAGPAPPAGLPGVYAPDERLFLDLIRLVRVREGHDVPSMHTAVAYLVQNLDPSAARVMFIRSELVQVTARTEPETLYRIMRVEVDLGPLGVGIGPGGIAAVSHTRPLYRRFVTAARDADQLFPRPIDIPAVANAAGNLVEQVETHINRRQRRDAIIQRLSYPHKVWNVVAGTDQEEAVDPGLRHPESLRNNRRAPLGEDRERFDEPGAPVRDPENNPIDIASHRTFRSLQDFLEIFIGTEDDDVLRPILLNNIVDLLQSNGIHQGLQRLVFGDGNWLSKEMQGFLSFQRQVAPDYATPLHILTYNGSIWATDILMPTAALDALYRAFNLPSTVTALSASLAAYVRRKRRLTLEEEVNSQRNA